MGQPDVKMLSELLQELRDAEIIADRDQSEVALNRRWCARRRLEFAGLTALPDLLDALDRQREALEGCREIALRECRDEDEARNALHGRGLIFRLCDRALGGDDHE